MRIVTATNIHNPSTFHHSDITLIATKYKIQMNKVSPLRQKNRINQSTAITYQTGR